MVARITGEMEQLFSWFESQGGCMDRSLMTLSEIPGQGRGALSLKDIPENTTLFTLPRSLTLSTRTSSLPTLFTPTAWTAFNLHKGWVGLILCMMWEESRGTDSKWHEYLESLPKTFDTPMFWREEEIDELRGTAIFDKIGRTDAERDYHEVLIPAIKSRPDLFDSSLIETIYSLENYHRMGSRILSRSFHVEEWKGEDNEDEDGAASALEEGDSSRSDDIQGEEVGQATKSDSVMDVDMAESDQRISDGEVDVDGGSDDEDVEDPADVALVPMADMLNARYECGNAKLYYEPTQLKMVTTKGINAGEQIFNTYGDPPNSDLLRRYGHVDIISSPSSEFEGVFNPADIVEVAADLVVTSVQATLDDGSSKEADTMTKERVEWWLEEGGDDVFFVEISNPLPDDLVSFTKLLMLESSDWEKARDKGKPPKPKVDLSCLNTLRSVINKRLELYPTSLEEDESLLSNPELLSNNKRNALIVRISEKRILGRCLRRIEDAEVRLIEDEKKSKKSRQNMSDVNDRKRRREGEVGIGKKKRR